MVGLSLLQIKGLLEFWGLVAGASELPGNPIRPEHCGIPKSDPLPLPYMHTCLLHACMHADIPVMEVCMYLFMYVSDLCVGKSLYLYTFKSK